ncbi:MAG TPA: hypothetical protein DHN33_09170 [Eubacteriaceae bacterium]|nr:hypothetical protein [Eubacteriaceae bacterium]
MDYAKNLLIKTCELYYNLGMNQQEISKRLDISRVKVSRLLTEAKQKGIVNIEILYPPDNCIDLEKKVEEKYGIEESVIIASEGKSEDLIFAEVTKIAAEYMGEKINKTDWIGLAWGRTIKSMVSKLADDKGAEKVVQLLGNIGSSEYSGDVIVRGVAANMKSEANLLSAPAIVDNEAIKKAIISDGSIRQVLELQKQCNIAFVGIGLTDETSTLAQAGYLKMEDIENLKKAKALGEVCGWFIDGDGNICDTPLKDRVIGIHHEDLRKIPHVVAIGTGEKKAEAMDAILKSKLVDVLITDEKTVQAMLDKK